MGMAAGPSMVSQPRSLGLGLLFARTLTPLAPTAPLLGLARRAVMVATSAVDRSDLEIDLLGHPLLNIIFYGLVEILPAACVLYILRKLPPKRSAQGYQQIPSQ